MTMNDPIADFLTRIRNAQSVGKKWVDVPASKLKSRISYVLKEDSFIRDYIFIDDGIQGFLRLFLNYDNNGNPTITGLKRVSTPGCRVYVDSDKIPRVMNGMGTAIITTSKGVLSDKKARTMKVGGEVLCHIW